MSDVKGPAPFDVCGPLPTGVTVLEASAGTGKTFAIAALAARYVADGMPLDNLLLVTFTRMATGELRERVRERLVSAEEGLRRALGGVLPSGDDEVLQLLAQGRPDELEARHRRLGRALTDFDAATIATTHGFCEQVLSGLGVAGDVERDITFLEDLSDLREEVVDDLYIAWFHRHSSPPFDRTEALRIAKKSIENPFAPLEPRSAEKEVVPGIRRLFAEAVRKEVERRKRRSGILTFDDHLARLRNTLADEKGGAAACARLRNRYRVALVDEFQDTDPIQWEIMRRAFGEGDATLVLIGDPKQAIYAFRGADVYAYLDAGRHAATRATLDTNWRSDKDLLDAFDTMFHGSKLGHGDIPYRRVQAAKAHHKARLTGAPVPNALRLRIVHRDDGLVHLTEKGYISAEPGRLHIAEDLSADVVRLLSSNAEIVTRRPDGSAASAERVRPGHIAVLVRTNKNAEVVRNALDAAGVPAVINGAGSVLVTPTAREWLRLLEALERPTSAPRATSAALTWFIGWSAEQVASADGPAWENLHGRLHLWAGLLRRRGVASLLEAITRSEGLPARMLSRVEGERELTDLRHIGQLLHAVNTSQQLGITALTAWLRQSIAEAAQDTENEERNRRLESDAEAVQVLTIHRSKGLEFPIVYYPYLWDSGWIDDKDPPIFHDSAAGDERTIDVGGADGPDFSRHKAQFIEEQRGEDLRLTYVALTRAKHQAVMWWAGSWGSQDSALSRLLFSRDEEGNVATEGRKVPRDDQVGARFRALSAQAPACISLERSTGGFGEVWPAPPRPLVALEAGRFDRRLDSTWRRNSYSGITSAAHEAWVTSEPEQTVVSDETQTGAPSAPAVNAPDAEEIRLRSISASLADMPAGMDVGTFVHSVLETTDFAIADLEAELTRRISAEQARHRLDIGDPVAVVAGLQAAVETPLGPLMGEVRLRDISPADRVDEMTFELPLVGGDTPNAHLTVPAIASLLREHLPADHALAGYAARLEDPALRGDLRGYLTGSLDLVLRTRNPEGTQRFAVVDYKTNWLGTAGQPLSAWHYRPAALIQEMQGAHYPLQALLYTTALHRYLRWRLPAYDAERNLAGVLYLFVRGMTGAEAPRVGDQPCGVFAWKPPAALIEGLSDLLDRGSAMT